MATENKEQAEKNAYQQRMEEKAQAAQQAYFDLRETVDNPTDEQILAAVGDNLRAYNKQNDLKGANWGLAFGAKDMWGTLNPATRKSFEKAYNQHKKDDTLAKRRAQVIGSVGTGENKRDITRGTLMDIQNWGNNVDAQNITPEQITALNQYLGSNITSPTQDVTATGDNGNTVTSQVAQPMTIAALNEALMAQGYTYVLDDLGFVDEAGNYVVPHTESPEEFMARREREREALNYKVQQAALARQQARLGLADLAAGIGDIIKASGGAIVNPRDYQRMYDSLTEQQQTNFNNYLARMDALKAEQKAKQQLAEERAYQEQQLADERAYQERLAAEQARASQDNLRQKHLYDIALEEKKQEGRLKLQEEKAIAAMERLTKRLDAKQQENILKGNSLYFEGVNHQITPNDSLGVYGAIYGKILPYIINDAYYSDLLAGIEDPYAESSASKVRCAVASALNTASVQIPEEVKREIRQVLGVQQIAPQGDGNIDNAAVAKKKYKRKSDGQIFEYTDAEWNGFSQVVKGLYEPIQ